jgi:acetate kinase
MKDSLILVLNCGSSSVKSTLFSTQLKRVLDLNVQQQNVDDAVEELIKRSGIDPSRIQAIGHRFVHGGEQFWKSQLVQEETIKQLEALAPLAPLHNPFCLQGIKACLKRFPKVPELVVFDTAFHHEMPKVAASYALPGDLVKTLGIRRYGFHGIAHAYLWQTYAKKMGGSDKNKLITFHLGNGCSMSAIKGGHCLDTSMGFTPAEGLVMATRAGDIDSGVFEQLCDKAGKTPSEVMTILNNQSGLLGVSGISSNMEKLLNSKDERAQFAIELFCYRAVKYAGAYMAALGGVDAVLFSGGIGENAPVIREKIVQRMVWNGWMIDQEKNVNAVGLHLGDSVQIHSSASTVVIGVSAVDENSLIAEEVVKNCFR